MLHTRDGFDLTPSPSFWPTSCSSLNYTVLHEGEADQKCSIVSFGINSDHLTGKIQFSVSLCEFSIAVEKYHFTDTGTHNHMCKVNRMSLFLSQ